MPCIGKCIKEALKRAGKTQIWLGQEVGVSQNAVSNWCNSDNLRTSTMRKVQAVLHVPEFAALLGETGEDARVDPDEGFAHELQVLAAIWNRCDDQEREDILDLIRSVNRIATRHSPPPGAPKDG